MMGGVENMAIYRQRFLDEAEAEMTALMREQKKAVGLELLSRLIDSTPVDEGEARRGWHASSPRPTGQDQQTDDPYSGLADAAIGGSFADPLYIQNNVDHARVLDEGLFVPPDPGPSKDPRPGRKGRILVSGGYSVQAPRGMTRDAVDGVAQRFGLQKWTGPS